MLKQLCAVLVAGGALAACSESTVPTTPHPQSPSVVAPNPTVLAELTCRVDAASMRCAPKGATSDADFSPTLIFGGQNNFVKLTSSNVTTVPTVSTTADVTMKNLTTQRWNTVDGVTADTGGVKVFFATAPSNGVTLHNGADGSDTFTAPNQPFYKYTTQLGLGSILDTGAVSSSKTWQFDLHGQTNFTFTLLLVTAMPDETGPLHWATDTLVGSQYLSGAWGASANDVWVSGDIGTGATHAMNHWDGATWTPFSVAQTCYAVWGDASTDVFAAGSVGVYRWNGTGWGVSLTSLQPLFAVWGSSSSSVFAGGAQGLMEFFNGAVWTPATTNIGSTEQINSIWGASATDMYVATSNGAANDGLHHFDGTNWTTVTAAGITTGLAVWGSSASDVYVGGDSGFLRHWDGGSWTTENFFNTSADITGIFGLSANSVYVVQASGELWHFNGTNWQLVSSNFVHLTGGWATTGHVFAVGRDLSTQHVGNIIHGGR